MIKIDAQQLAILCACQFIAHFDFSDLRKEEYVSDYRSTLDGIDYLFWCKVIFSAGHARVVEFCFDMYAIEGDGGVEVTGSLKRAKENALVLINNYLDTYDVIYKRDVER